MSTILDGYAASEGIAVGKVLLIEWGVPEVPHEMVEPDDVEREVERFHEAREWAKARIRKLQKSTEDRLGPIEARIFEPQILMLDDPVLVDRALLYVRENRLTAARALDIRMLELQAQWTRTAHPMVLDRLNDLEDLQIRLLHRLLDIADPSDVGRLGEEVIVVAKNLTPSLVTQMDLTHVLGIATDQGTRTSHWVILARSLEIPVVVGLGDISRKVETDQEAILDGRIGRIVLDPDDEDRAAFKERETQIRAWEEDIAVIARMDPVTADGQPIALRANIDLPGEAQYAVSHGAQGIGLFRTEFLVVGRNSLPGEDEQYETYRSIAEAFPTGAVIIRTYDLGGDKFPMFLHMPREENPFLGWRAVRVCLDVPELFRTQLRAILRASAHGDVRIMIPLVNDVEEILQVRALLEEEEEKLRRDGIPYNPGTKLGILVETPAATLEAVELSRHCDFFSIGTNDLTQYTLAVDRTNSRLAKLFNPFHPAVVRQLHQVARVARASGIEVSVCGEMAANPLGAFLLLGLDITALSVAWPSIPEIKHVIRQFRMEDARKAARTAVSASTSQEIMDVLTRELGKSVDLSVFSGRWSLSLPDKP
ncbi:MAG: phosphoenolpyruvate--protein phosphotransferase [Longimicrobiales bacterium]